MALYLEDCRVFERFQMGHHVDLRADAIPRHVDARKGHWDRVRSAAGAADVVNPRLLEMLQNEQGKLGIVSTHARPGQGESGWSIRPLLRQLGLRVSIRRFLFVSL